MATKRTLVFASVKTHRRTAMQWHPDIAPPTHTTTFGEVLTKVADIQSTVSNVGPLTREVLEIMETARQEAQAARMRHDGARRFGRAAA